MILNLPQNTCKKVQMGSQNGSNTKFQPFKNQLINIRQPAVYFRKYDCPQDLFSKAATNPKSRCLIGKNHQISPQINK